MSISPNGTTPGGNQSSVASSGAIGSTDSGEPEAPCHSVKSKFKKKNKYFFGTLNINSLLKTGKLKQMIKVLNDYHIQILALQETRFTDENVMDSEGFRIFKGKPGRNRARGGAGIPHLGTGFIVHSKFVNAVQEFYSPNDRLSILSFRSLNKTYTLINCHAPINVDNKKNPNKVDQYWESLEHEVSKIPTSNVKILLGDFNAQIGRERKHSKTVGPYPAHKRTNRNGERLIELCKGNNLKLMSTHFKKLPKQQKTWKSPNSNLGEFQIDHVAISFNHQKEVMNVKVRKGANIETDHYLTSIKMNFIPLQKVKSRRTPVQRIDRVLLKSRREEFNQKLEVDTNNWDELKEKVVKVALEVAPLKKSAKHPWWDEKCEEAIDLRLKCWKKWYSTKNANDYENFKKQRSLTAKIIRSTKRNFEKDQLAQIEDAFKKNNTRSFYSTFKRNLHPFQSPNLCFRNEEGKLTINNTENCKVLATYFEKLLNCEEPANKFDKVVCSTRYDDSQAPTTSEIKEIIKDLKTNKAAGEDNIIAEIWKYADMNVVRKIQGIIQEIWESESIPEEWKVALIHPLHKKGDKADPNNYRGISLLPVTYKILSKALLNRLEPQLDNCIGEYQGGFRKGRSCVEQILNLKLILKYRKIRGKDIVVTFVDFKKAYDSIDRETLFNTLEEFGADTKTVAIVKESLRNTKSKVKFMGELSDPFEIRTGLRQGDGLSPLLFNCILEKVIREWRIRTKEEDIPTVRIGVKKDNLDIDCLAFADDLAIFADDITSAIKQIEILKEIAEKTGLQISFEKTEFITTIKRAPKQMKTKYGVINKVEKFKYLGEIIQANAMDKEANHKRVNKMEVAFQLTKNFYNKKSISINAKIRHYQTVIKPECLYASECLSLHTKNQFEEIEKKERKIIRRILGPRFDNGVWKLRSNEEVYQKSERLTTTMKKRRVTFYAHIKRMDDSRLTKRIFNYFDKRPKTQVPWFKEVKKDLEEIGIVEEDIFNRNVLRNKVDSFAGFQQQPKKKTGARWTDERKQQHAERMKRFWKEKKERRTLQS
ncbi:hypothetical protein M8J77_000651 [Diaphorina citri]|nr:hypothetical protein M8J77_000651 [Diaphorina citri]